MKVHRRHCHSRDHGASSVEYAVLVAMLAFILIGTITELGTNTRNKLCYASGRDADANEDGRVDQSDEDTFIGDYNRPKFDMNCNGLTAAEEAANSAEGVALGPSNTEDWNLFFEYYENEKRRR